MTQRNKFENLEELLKNSLCYHTHLTIDLSKSCDKFGPQGESSLASALAVCQNLKTLNIIL
ncbi:hypothetical protein ABPG74_006922, partial [Tetrahymena malaccensis]